MAAEQLTPTSDTVLTFPIAFSTQQVELLKQSGHIADLNVLSAISDLSAGTHYPFSSFSSHQLQLRLTTPFVSWNLMVRLKRLSFTIWGTLQHLSFFYLSPGLTAPLLHWSKFRKVVEQVIQKLTGLISNRERNIINISIGNWTCPHWRSHSGRFGNWVSFIRSLGIIFH